MIKILLSKKLGEMRMTQADLSRATGIRANTINELYHELAERVNLEHLDLICEALHCELDELIIRIPNDRISVTHTRQGTKKSKDTVSLQRNGRSKKRVSAKYCYATHELRLHQNDRCKRFTLF